MVASSRISIVSLCASYVAYPSLRRSSRTLPDQGVSASVVRTDDEFRVGCGARVIGGQNVADRASSILFSTLLVLTLVGKKCQHIASSPSAASKTSCSFVGVGVVAASSSSSLYRSRLPNGFVFPHSLALPHRCAGIVLDTSVAVGDEVILRLSHVDAFENRVDFVLEGDEAE